jgi:hypothetical protein
MRQDFGTSDGLMYLCDFQISISPEMLLAICSAVLIGCILADGSTWGRDGVSRHWAVGACAALRTFLAIGYRDHVAAMV